MAKGKHTTHHVVRHPEGGWAVKKGGALRATKRFSTKQEAVAWGREVSRNQGSEFVIHRKDGTIQRKASHGGDPHPPTDRA
jgi:uncharacterized protein YdaT